MTTSTVTKYPAKVIENEDYLVMMRRLVSKWAERVGDGDPEDLEGMLRVAHEMDEAIGLAVAGQRKRHGFSWTEIARGAGMTRQGAQQRWGKFCTGEAEHHDYEPGTSYHPMHTDPLCRVCGQPSNARIHETTTTEEEK